MHEVVWVQNAELNSLHGKRVRVRGRPIRSIRSDDRSYHLELVDELDDVAIRELCRRLDLLRGRERVHEVCEAIHIDQIIENVIESEVTVCTMSCV